MSTKDPIHLTNTQLKARIDSVHRFLEGWNDDATSVWVRYVSFDPWTNTCLAIVRVKFEGLTKLACYRINPDLEFHELRKEI